MSDDADAMRLELARQRRDTILATGVWHTAASAFADSAGHPEVRATSLRNERALFGVRFRGRFLYPDFQFASPGEPRKEMRDLMALLPVEESNWVALFWLYQPSRALDGDSPAAMFPKDPARVIAHAHAAFVLDENSW